MLTCQTDNKLEWTVDPIYFPLAAHSNMISPFSVPASWPPRVSLSSNGFQVPSNGACNNSFMGMVEQPEYREVEYMRTGKYQKENNANYKEKKTRKK